MTVPDRRSRRRVLRIAAAAAGVAALPWRGTAPRAAAVDLHRWRGTALGAVATISLYHPEARTARRLIEASVAEIVRLEDIFSLYRPDSVLSTLNRSGALAAPPHELVELLEESRRVHALTGGAFDPTVQPLWRRYADHFTRADADPAGPPVDLLAQARALIGFDAVAVRARRIAFGRAGMALTLNGIAQGYITDRVADLLRAGGIDNVLLDLGETRGLGRHPDGRPWRVGIRHPRDPAALFRTLEIAEQAVATSGGYGLVFDAGGRHHHLLDPASGRSADGALSVTVVADRATTADALSTAIAVMPSGRIAATIAAAGVRAIVWSADGTIRTYPG